ncbi:MAG TPA: DNA-binding domain-containing protein [Solirubrobacteraceae bacterium]|nr:DNA-binding domain-containing protein [Solirubrobacteraceae bacterium]
MSDAGGLRSLQEWLRAVITDPDGARAGLSSEAARRVAPGELEAIVRSTSRLSAGERLELYSRSHRMRLLEVMRVTYPGLRHMLGNELFDDFALDYLQARPSRSYTLHDLGAAFADHLAATRPDADGVPEAWTSMVIDLARLERTFAEVYDAPGAEGERLPAGADLPSGPGLRWLEATVEPVRCLRLLRSSFPAGEYLSAVRRGDEPPEPVPAASFLAVSRRHYVVTLTPLETRSYRLLSDLVGGARVGAAAAAAGIDRADSWRLVRNWADSGFFRSLAPHAQTATPVDAVAEEPVTP